MQMVVTIPHADVKMCVVVVVVGRGGERVPEEGDQQVGHNDAIKGTCGAKYIYHTHRTRHLYI